MLIISGHYNFDALHIMKMHLDFDLITYRNEIHISVSHSAAIPLNVTIELILATDIMPIIQNV